MKKLIPQQERTSVRIIQLSYLTEIPTVKSIGNIDFA